MSSHKWLGTFTDGAGAFMDGAGGFKIVTVEEPAVFAADKTSVGELAESAEC